MKINARGVPYYVSNKYYDIKSPNKQVKRNAVKIKQIIESSKAFKKPTKIYVEGIVVFTNPNVDLQLINTTVPVLTIDKLCEYIINKKSNIKFSHRELESIGKILLNLASD